MNRQGNGHTTAKWIVRFGQCANTYFTRYHADQFMRALQLNGTAFNVEEVSSEIVPVA